MGVAMVTPFTVDNKVDYQALTKLTEFLVSKGCDYLVVQGTTGETPTLNTEEKRRILDCVIEVNNDRLPIVLGMGGNNTYSLAEEMQRWDLSGVQAILSVTPYYSKPNQNGLYAHYKYISEASPLPIILYNVPSRTGCNLSAETTLRLAHDFDNIIAIKEASGDLGQVYQILNQKPEDFLVISGDDLLALPIIQAGGDGVISVIGNAFPRDFSEMVHFALAGKNNLANEIHFKFQDLIHAIFEEGNPAGIKEIMHAKGICESHLRLPLVNVSSALASKLNQLLNRFSISVL